MATAKRPKTEQDKYRSDIVRRMKAVGTYRREFSPTIERLAALYIQRERIETQFKESGENAVILTLGSTVLSVVTIPVLYWVLRRFV